MKMKVKIKICEVQLPPWPRVMTIVGHDHKRETQMCMQISTRSTETCENLGFKRYSREKKTPRAIKTYHNLHSGKYIIMKRSQNKTSESSAV